MEINIAIVIDDAKVDDLKLGLAKYFKVDSMDITPAWFKGFLQDMIYKFYSTGKIQIARDTTAPQVDEMIIEVQ